MFSAWKINRCFFNKLKLNFFNKHTRWDHQSMCFCVHITHFHTTVLVEHQLFALAKRLDVHVKLLLVLVRHDRFQHKVVELASETFNFNVTATNNGEMEVQNFNFFFAVLYVFSLALIHCKQVFKSLLTKTRPCLPRRLTN